MIHLYQGDNKGGLADYDKALIATKSPYSLTLKALAAKSL